MRFIKDNLFAFEIAGWLISTAVIVVVFLFSTFQTRADSKENIKQYDEKTSSLVQYIDKRLDRLEQKVDHLIEKKEK